MMPTSMWVTSFLLLLGPLVSGSVLFAQTAAGDSSAIHQLGRQFSAAYMRGDAAAMADLWEHAYDYGTFEIAGERDGTAWGPSRGKYVVVWRRDQGGWRMQLDIWNSSDKPESEPGGSS
jgi:ketosteroid isomerase-like protein